MYYEDFVIKYVDKKYRNGFKRQMEKWMHTSKLYGTWCKIGVLRAAYKQTVMNMER